MASKAALMRKTTSLICLNFVAATMNKKHMTTAEVWERAEEAARQTEACGEQVMSVNHLKKEDTTATIPGIMYLRLRSKK